MKHKYENVQRTYKELKSTYTKVMALGTKLHKSGPKLKKDTKNIFRQESFVELIDLCLKNKHDSNLYQ